jgi:hypothetical protein
MGEPSTCKNSPRTSIVAAGSLHVLAPLFGSPARRTRGSDELTEVLAPAEVDELTRGMIFGSAREPTCGES